MLDIIQYATSSFWVFIAFWIVLALFFKGIVDLFKVLVFTKSGYIKENDMLKKQIEDLKKED